MEKKYRAFGERKTLTEWGRDPRCPVSTDTLRDRVLLIGMTVEQAFAVKPRAAGDVPAERLYEAFGERKTLYAWSRDPRCPVSEACLRRRVHDRGMTVEQALAAPPQKPKHVAEGFGERKSLSAWSRDPRCPISLACLVRRVLVQGKTVEQAFATKADLVKHMLSAFGERKPLNAWGRDPRCPVTRQALHVRVVKMGLTIEEAFALGPGEAGKRPGRPRKYADDRATRRRANPPKPRGRPRNTDVRTITAWGETRTPEEWAADPRARVSARLIVQRVRSGYTPEQAITMRRGESRGPECFPATPSRPRQKRSR